MEIESLPVEGAKLITTDVFCDDRGAFEEAFDYESLSRLGVEFQPNSGCFSYNESPHTLRGMHFQKSPYAQSKLVSCVQGRAWDVIVDLRPQSGTFGRWCGRELVAASGLSVLVPAGCAHGFMTLESGTTIAYLIQGAYRPESGRALSWNDTSIGIEWPCSDPILSAKDAAAPDWNSCEF
ncbi:dTDP-4-dehydrorhamnose 3,5-epimerase family protein [Allorhodopirellula solitaria]|uniref:dTDP-4-dehydrorhamnose 3,5-epimerase n=1 Tax=Allorhodopirellula solitaria TaxID=2527987 RepID=A0A5C5YB61_9BACT|nr:dTDP-4-dehydrorhamnose 3,5-epimerase family protein [Allorhodopirellula solitaria]TWT72946.1 dTDP-4-dehydrorhamnose 3,5-epimerase [Allorhodopirellula solitaria]